MSNIIQADPFQLALSKLAENRLRVTIEGRIYAARVVAVGEKVPTAIKEDCVIAFGDGVVVKCIPLQDYLSNWQPLYAPATSDECSAP
jgi:hypothetical protein